MADDQLCFSYEFESAFFPGLSCEDIYNKNPLSCDKSGYYWITDVPSNVEWIILAYHVSISITTIVKPVARMDIIPLIINSGSSVTWLLLQLVCLPSLVLVWEENGEELQSLTLVLEMIVPMDGVRVPTSFCISPNDNRGCYPTTFSTNHANYQRVCGRVRGYQKGTPDGFRSGNVDDIYADGLSITHGSPRQHKYGHM